MNFHFDIVEGADATPIKDDLIARVRAFNYSVFGEIEDFPPGHTFYYLRKKLAD